MKTAVTATSITAYHQTAELRQSEAERMARYILQETDAGRSVWIRKAARDLGWEANSAGRALNQLLNSEDFIWLDGRPYMMRKRPPERDPITMKLGQAWELLRVRGWAEGQDKCELKQQ